MYFGFCSVSLYFCISQDISPELSIRNLLVIIEWNLIWFLVIITIILIKDVNPVPLNLSSKYISLLYRL